jgi:hypothetical protein
VMLDFRRIDLGRMTAVEVEQRVELLARSGERIGRCHTAVVVGRDIDFGMARMQQALSERRASYEISVDRGGPALVARGVRLAVSETFLSRMG